MAKQEQSTEKTLLAGKFETAEELAEAYLALQAERDTVQQTFETEKDKAVDAAIKQFQANHRKSLGTLTPNAIPGSNRKPVKSPCPAAL